MNGPKFLYYERRKIDILVVEQEAQLHPLLQMALEPHGYNLHFSTNLQQGLDLLQQHKEEIALVLFGGSILGPNVQQTIEEFRGIKPEVVFLVMTGDIFAHKPEQIAEMGILHVFKKPFHVAELVQVFERVTKQIHRDRLFADSERVAIEEDEHAK